MASEVNQEFREIAVNILVTGGAGFIGSHLISRLLTEGHHITCLDNYSTGDPRHVAAHQDNCRFSFVRHDIIQPWIPPEGSPFQQIYHLACPASPKHYQADPLQTIRTGIWGTYHLLELAKQQGSRILIASTSEVYGDPEVHPQAETYWGHVNPIGRRACYDETKRLSETLAFDHRRQHQTDIAVARIFNTYGPAMRADDGRVVSNFMVQALQGQELTLYGDGSQTRSFCYVSDLVEGLIRLMDSGESGPINLGNPKESTIRELADQVLSLTQSPAGLRFCPLPEDDPHQRCPDITKAQTLLGWDPQVNLRDGLDLTQQDFLARFQQNLL